MATPEHLPAFRTFRQDLRHTLRVWRSDPGLPLLAVAIEAGPYIVAAIVYWLIGFPECNSFRGRGCGPLLPIVELGSAVFALVFIGWYGTQRIWYLRAFRGTSLQRGELWSLNKAFWGRYFRLGIIVFLAMVPVLLLGLATAGVMLIVGTFALDAALTFVTPSLAFSTESVIEAIRNGFGLARRTWPASALYLFIPPLAIRAAAAAAWGRRSAVVLAIVADTVSVLLLCWFRGATARFYLRFNEAGQDGAAFPESSEESRG